MCHIYNVIYKMRVYVFLHVETYQNMTVVETVSLDKEPTVGGKADPIVCCDQ